MCAPRKFARRVFYSRKLDNDNLRGGYSSATYWARHIREAGIQIFYIIITKMSKVPVYEQKYDTFKSHKYYRKHAMMSNDCHIGLVLSMAVPAWVF